MQINDDTSRALEQIRVYKHDLDQFDQRIKTMSEMVKDMVESMPEFEALVELDAKLKEAKAQFKSRLMGKAEYNDALTELADEREARKSAAKQLSDVLVVWYTLTGSSQIELTEENAQEVIVSAKLGKEQLFQTNMFERKED